MHDPMTFERQLADALNVYAALAPDMDDVTIARQAVASDGRSRFGWLQRPQTRRVLILVTVGLLTVALLAAGLLAGASLLLPGKRLPGAFIPTGPTAYEYDTAGVAALRDGRVLFVGGATAGLEGAPGEYTGFGEIFDPETNTFARTSNSMSEGRYASSVTTLRDGRVLVAGGQRPDFDLGGSSLATAELFDPATGTFAPTAVMSTRREGHLAVLLADGRVLVAGGETLTDGSGVQLASAEIFDPGTDSWSEVGGMSYRRSWPIAALLADGNVLVTGGWDGDAGLVATAELFNTATSTFEPTGSMSVARIGHTATMLSDGRVLIVGGGDGGSSLASAEVFDPATGQFLITGSLTTERGGHSSTLLADGRVLVTGGSNDFGGPRSAEIYDPSLGTFELAASASGAHTGPAVRLSNGRVLVAGGQPEVFDPSATTPVATTRPRADRTFVAAGEPVEQRRGHSAIKLTDGRVLIVGGGSQLRSAEVYIPTTDSFAVTGSIAASLAGGLGRIGGRSLLLVDDGRVLMIGGELNSWDLQIYDPGIGQFAHMGSLNPNGPTVRQPITAARLADGRIIAFGPSTVFRTSSRALSVAYELDVAGARMTRIADLSGCGVHAAIPIAGDGVVVLCGFGGQREIARLFDPATGDLTLLPIDLEFSPASMVPLADGRILLANGTETTSLNVFDPATGTLTPAGTLARAADDASPAPSTVASLTVLEDDRVLVLQGQLTGLWDPSTGMVTRLPDMIAHREGETTTLLDDDRVLIVGGTKWPADRSEPRPPGAETFDPRELP